MAARAAENRKWTGLDGGKRERERKRVAQRRTGSRWMRGGGSDARSRRCGPGVWRAEGLSERRTQELWGFTRRGGGRGGPAGECGCESCARVAGRVREGYGAREGSERVKRVAPTRRVRAGLGERWAPWRRSIDELGEAAAAASVGVYGRGEKRQKDWKTTAVKGEQERAGGDGAVGAAETRLVQERCRGIRASVWGATKRARRRAAS